jgi:hypothetical protein
VKIEAAPLVSIASFVCPRSHGACRPLRALGLDLRTLKFFPVEPAGGIAARAWVDITELVAATAARAKQLISGEQS